MGSVSAIKLLQVVENVSTVLAIELIIAAQAIDIREMPSSPALDAAKAKLRELVPGLAEDRVMYQDIQASIELIKNAEILQAVEATGLKID